MDLKLSGKKALVTGSTLGIGRAIAEALIKEGASLVINGRDEKRVSQVVNELADMGVVKGLAADLSTPRGVDFLITNIATPIDIIINNVGYFEVRSFFEIEDNDWSKIFETNVMSGVRLCRALIKPMLLQDWGRVIFIGSDQSSKPNPAMAHYAMTKTAQVSIARSLAELTRGTNVTVNSVLAAPTWTHGVKTFMEKMAKNENTTPEKMSKSYFSNGEGQTSLLERWAKPDEIASFVTYLCSPQASAINGAALRVDGGMIRSLF